MMANAPLKVLSLLIAVVLWFVVLGSRNVEITKDVPLEVVTPPDLVVANDVPDRVSFRLSGPKAFLRNILNRKEPPIRVNLTNAKAGLVTYRFFSDNIQVPIGVKVLFINPTSIVVKLEEVKSREVPVRLVTKGSSAPGFRIAGMELMSGTVRIKGAESKVEGVTELQTVPLDLATLHESGDKEAALDLSRMGGVFIDGPSPKVHFDVVQESAQFRLKNIRVKVLADKRAAVEPKEVNIYVSCASEDLKKLVKSRIFAVVDLRKKGPGAYVVPVTVELPPAVRLVKVLPQKVKVTLF